MSLLRNMDITHKAQFEPHWPLQDPHAGEGHTRTGTPSFSDSGHNEASVPNVLERLMSQIQRRRTLSGQFSLNSSSVTDSKPNLSVSNTSAFDRLYLDAQRKQASLARRQEQERAAAEEATLHKPPSKASADQVRLIVQRMAGEAAERLNRQRKRQLQKAETETRTLKRMQATPKSNKTKVIDEDKLLASLYGLPPEAPRKLRRPPLKPVPAATTTQVRSLEEQLRALQVQAQGRDRQCQSLEQWRAWGEETLAVMRTFKLREDLGWS